jgi:hypothetical protein
MTCKVEAPSPVGLYLFNRAILFGKLFVAAKRDFGVATSSERLKKFSTYRSGYASNFFDLSSSSRPKITFFAS